MQTLRINSLLGILVTPEDLTQDLESPHSRMSRLLAVKSMNLTPVWGRPFNSSAQLELRGLLFAEV